MQVLYCDNCGEENCFYQERSYELTQYGNENRTVEVDMHGDEIDVIQYGDFEVNDSESGNYHVINSTRCSTCDSEVDWIEVDDEYERPNFRNLDKMRNVKKEFKVKKVIFNYEKVEQ